MHALSLFLLLSFAPSCLAAEGAAWVVSPASGPLHAGAANANGMKDIDMSIYFVSHVLGFPHTQLSTIICPPTVHCPLCHTQTLPVTSFGGEAPLYVQGSTPNAVAHSYTKQRLCVFVGRPSAATFDDAAVHSMSATAQFAGGSIANASVIVKIPLDRSAAPTPGRQWVQMSNPGVIQTSTTSTDLIQMDFLLFGRQIDTWRTQSAMSMGFTFRPAPAGQSVMCCPETGNIQQMTSAATSAHPSVTTLGGFTWQYPCHAVLVADSAPLACSYHMREGGVDITSGTTDTAALTFRLSSFGATAAAGATNFTEWYENSTLVTATAVVAPPTVAPDAIPTVADGTGTVVCGISRCDINIVTEIVGPIADVAAIADRPLAAASIWGASEFLNLTKRGRMVVPGAGVSLSADGRVVQRTYRASGAFYGVLVETTRFRFDTSASASRLNASGTGGGEITVAGAYYNFWTNPAGWIDAAHGAANNTLATVVISFADPAAVSGEAFGAKMVPGSSTRFTVTAPLVLGLPLVMNDRNGSADVLHMAGLPSVPQLYPVITVAQTAHPTTEITVTPSMVRWDNRNFHINGLFRGTVDLSSSAVKTDTSNYTVLVRSPFSDGLGSWVGGLRLSHFPVGTFQLTPHITPFVSTCSFVGTGTGELGLSRFGERSGVCTLTYDTRRFSPQYTWSLENLVVVNATPCVVTIVSAEHHLETAQCGAMRITGTPLWNSNSGVLHTGVVAAGTGAASTVSVQTIRYAPNAAVSDSGFSLIPRHVRLPLNANLSFYAQHHFYFFIKGPVIGHPDAASSPPPVNVTATLAPSGATVSFRHDAAQVSWAVVGSEWSTTLWIKQHDLVGATEIVWNAEVPYFDAVSSQWRFAVPPPPNWPVLRAKTGIEQTEPENPHRNNPETPPPAPETFGEPGLRTNTVSLLFVVGFVGPFLLLSARAAFLASVDVKTSNERTGVSVAGDFMASARFRSYMPVGAFEGADAREPRGGWSILPHSLAQRRAGYSLLSSKTGDRL